jgi:glutaconate CoA-transferase subunit A
MTMLAEGVGEFLPPDPDGFRRYIREHKDRRLVDKVMTEQDAVSRFVDDGDYLSYDLNIACRGPSSLFREVIRQKKRDLWVAAKFSWSDITLLVAGGCVSKVDVGWMETGPIINQALQEGRIKLFEWSNGALAYRHLAGAMGLPFLPLRYIGGTDVFANSGAKLMEDPYTGKPICLVPALNPDVALIHVNQCDVYGNARVFGAGVSPLETAMAAKKLIISTEEIIDTESIRRQPQRTTIPYYLVDAVVLAPFGSYPGAVQGLYQADFGALFELALTQYQQKTDEYLEKWVFSVSSHEEMLESRVGVKKLMELRQAEKIREGYYE